MTINRFRSEVAKPIPGLVSDRDFAGKEILEILRSAYLCVATMQCEETVQETWGQLSLRNK